MESKECIKTDLDRICLTRRRELIELLHRFGTGHPGGSLSATEIITTLYYKVMDVEKIKAGDSDRDRFVISKGHCAPMVYLTLADLGFFPESEFDLFRQIGGNLQGHPCAEKTKGIEVSTGPLGLGMSAAAGIALAGKIDEKDYYTYVLLGDGEIQEGVIWETAMSAAKYKLDNMICFLDYNGVQLDGKVDDIMPLGDVEAKWKAFGWNVLNIDGHNVLEIMDAVEKAKELKGAPTIIIARTTKGKGVSFMEDTNTWHGKPIDDESYAQAVKELGGVANA